MNFRKISCVGIALALSLPMLAADVQAAFDDNFDARQQELRKRIDTGKSSGKLTESELREVNKQYWLLEGKQRAFARDGFDSSEREQLRADFEKLEASLDRQLNDRQGSGPSDLDGRLSELKTRMERARTAGRLTAQDYFRLNRAVKDFELTMRQYSYRGLNFNERKLLSDKLDSIQNDFKQQNRDDDTRVSTDLNSRLEGLKTDMDRAHRTGRLTAPEFNSLSRELLGIQTDMKRFSYRGLSQSEREILVNRTKSLEATFKSQARDTDVRTSRNDRIDNRQRDLLSEMRQARSNGKLTEAEYSQLREDYRAIERLQQRAAAGGLSRLETKDLQDRLAQLESKLDRESSDRDRIGGRSNRNERIDARQTNLRRDIEASRRSGKLSRTEYDRLNALMRDVEQTQRLAGSNGLSRSEMQLISSKLDQVETGLSRLENNQTTVTTGNHRWMPSRDGGYYDATGNVKGTVKANELYKYGGVMSDGSSVPATANVRMNEFGHLIR